MGLSAFLFSSCVSRSELRIISTEKTLTSFDWTAEEIKKDIAIKTLTSVPEASYHLARLNAAEKPHIHRDHDLAVFILKGKARMHLANRVVEVRPGDVIEVGRGIVHWAERVGKEPAYAYVIFTPAFDGKDAVPAK